MTWMSLLITHQPYYTQIPIMMGVVVTLLLFICPCPLLICMSPEGKNC